MVNRNIAVALISITSVSGMGTSLINHKSPELTSHVSMTSQEKIIQRVNSYETIFFRPMIQRSVDISLVKSASKTCLDGLLV